MDFRAKFPHRKIGQKFSFRRFGKRFTKYSLYGLVVVLLFSAVTFAIFTRDLPTPSKIAGRKATESTKIYDRTGQTLLYETGDQKRTIVSSDQISQYLKDATVATEDANFYRHNGFDARAIFSALYESATGQTRRTRGGSTITQQFVKNALLNSNRSLVRKGKELILAIELEMMFDKEQILTMYLNEVPYGSNTAGAEAAARTYYGKPAKDLTIAEAATLAAIPKSPTYYSPYGTHIQQLINRRNYVLDRMVDIGKITAEEAKKAKEEDTTTLGTKVKPRRDNILAPHFAMYVLEEVAARYGEEKIQKEGLKIITTLDYDKQKIAEEAITKGSDKISRYGATNAAMVSVDPKTGQIVAMVGSRDYFDTSIDGNVNVADSLRQPGSSFKPFAYATAFKKKEYSPSKILFDFQTDFGGGYTPQNYNGRFNGPVTMRTALANSLNIPAVKVLSLAGIDNVLRTAEDLGITTLNQRDRYGLSLVLGAGEVRPVEMAGAFGVFATGGVKHDLRSYLKITDSRDNLLYEYKADKDVGRQVLDPQIAYEMNSILSDNDARSMIFGPRSALYFADRPVAAKTGTTSDFKDAWTVGYTPSLAAAVWVGNSNAVKMKTGADGSVLAAPIFHIYMEKALANTAVEQFNRPEGITELEVEKYSNKLPNEFSAEKTKDIFASWQVPTEKDDVNKIVRMCKGMNKLAPDNLAEQLIENKVFKSIHSERPDNSNWENPVRGWAAENGYTDSIPKEYCSADEFALSVKITSPITDSKPSGKFSITAETSSATSIQKVEFSIDGISILSDDSAPYSADYDASNLSAGSHKISVIATDANGLTATDTIDISIEKDSAGPTISNVVAVPTSSTVTISWQTSKPATGQLFFGTTTSTNTAGYSSSTAKNVALTPSHALTLSTLIPNTKYYYRLVSIDALGNITTSNEYTFTTSP